MPCRVINHVGRYAICHMPYDIMMPCCVVYDDVSDDLEQRRRLMERASQDRAHVTSLESQLADVEQKNNQLQSQITRLTSHAASEKTTVLEQFQSQVEENQILRKQLNTYQQQIHDLQHDHESRIQELRNRYDKELDAINERIRMV